MIARSRAPADTMHSGSEKGQQRRNKGHTMSEQVEPISAALRISHYSTLGVDEHATQTQIRDAYRRAVQRCHPDRFQGVPEAEAAFKEITVAYKVLRDPRSRHEYDRRLGRVHGRDTGHDDFAERRGAGDTPVDDVEMQRFEGIADGHARRGLEAPAIASHLIAQGSPYQLAWQLAWQARRRMLANNFAGQSGHGGYAASPAWQAPAAHSPAMESERAGNWQESRERHARQGTPFQALKSRLSKGGR